MKPHKLAKEIKAWADGAEIEMRYPNEKEYPEMQEWAVPFYLTWDDEDAEYRIKPQPKEPQYLYVYRCTEDGELRLHEDKDLEGSRWKLKGKIKLEADDVGTS